MLFVFRNRGKAIAGISAARTTRPSPVQAAQPVWHRQAIVAVMGSATFKPPNLFGIVEPGVFRSNAPLEENLPFLDNLRLRTVLFLSPEVLLRTVEQFFTEKSIRVHPLGLDAWRPEPDWTPLCDEFIKDALEMLVSTGGILLSSALALR
jgi:hypothetical protein